MYDYVYHYPKKVENRVFGATSTPKSKEIQISNFVYFLEKLKSPYKPNFIYLDHREGGFLDTPKSRKPRKSAEYMVNRARQANFLNFDFEFSVDFFVFSDVS